MITPSKSNPLQGEIALTLTVLSFAIMLIGTMFGGIQQQQKTSSQAAGTCKYYANAVVQKRLPNGRLELLTYKDNNYAPLTTRNDRGSEMQLFKAPLTDDAKASRDYDAKGKFTPAPYAFGDHPSVKLFGLDESKWQVESTYCSRLGGNPPNPLGKGCGDADTGDQTYGSERKLRINNFLITCDVNITYGWIVEPATTGTNEPTSTPTIGPIRNITTKPGFPTVIPDRSTSCIFKPTAYVKLQLADKTEIPLDVKVEQNVTAWKFTNSAKVASTFTTTGSRTYTSDNLRSVEFCCGTQNDANGHTAGLTYSVGHAPLTSTGDNAKVTLSNYVPLPGKDARYEIVKKIGMDGNTATGGTLDRIEGLKVACDTPAFSYSYGWVLKCTGADCYRPLVVSTPATLTSIPRSTPVRLPVTVGPTKRPSCSNNVGTISGTVRTIISTTELKKTASPNIVKTLVTIKVCGMSIDKEDTADCSIEYGKQDIRGGETEYNIPNVPLNTDVAVVYQIATDNTFKATVKMSNCSGANKRLGKFDILNGQACIVQLAAPVCSTGPDFDINMVVPTPSYIPPTPIQQTVGHIELEPIQDTFVQSGRANQNTHFGKEDLLVLGYENDPARNPNDQLGINQILLQFDLSKLKGTKITSAKLNIAFDSCEYNRPTPNEYDLAYVSGYKYPWKESEITWNNLTEKRTTSDIPLGKVEYVCNPTNPNTQDTNSALLFESIPFTRLVQQWTDNPNSNFGMRLDPTTNIVNQVNAYASRENSKKPHPKLIIDYEGTPTSPLPNNKPATPKTPVKSPIARRDLNGDKIINVVDFVLVLKKIGTKGANIPEDVNNDGVVNAVDGASIIVNFGKSAQ